MPAGQVLISKSPLSMVCDFIDVKTKMKMIKMKSFAKTEFLIIGNYNLF
jgi:hypothetical protein